MNFLKTPLFLVAALTLPVGATAQQPTSAAHNNSEIPKMTVHVQAREVLLPVTVRDKKGFVAGLGPKDFTLTEDGRPQTITGFARATDLPFRLGLLVDTSHSMTSALNAERNAAAKFVDLMLPVNAKQGQAGNQIFLIHFDRQVELLRDFTNQREKLHRELDEMESSRPAREERHGDGTDLYDAIFLASDELMKTVKGRKALIVFSDGVDNNSRETLNDAIDAADRAGLEVFTIYFKGEEQRGGGSAPANKEGGSGRRGGLSGSWPGSGGSGWPCSGGPGRGSGNERPKADGKKILEQIARRTGGRFFEARKKENLDEIYGQIADELRNQYLLTYAPDKSTADGQYHKILVKGRRDDWRVFAREGYYAGESK